MTIIDNYLQNQPLKNELRNVISTLSNEKNWNSLKQFLEYLYNSPETENFLTKICNTIFTIIDEEYSVEKTSPNLIGTCLTLLTEISVKFNEISEYTTSNMLSRSNMNNEVMRSGLIYYFSRVDPESKINLQKILNRFGQSLLEHVMQIYFCNEKKSNLAFYFLKDHLDSFLFSSPSLAEMSNSVLRTQMLKHSQEFPNLIKKYLSYKLKDNNPEIARPLTIHLSFLLKEACAIGQKNLIDSLLEITFSFIYSVKGKSKETSISLCEILGEIISTSKSVKGKEITSLIYDKILANKKLVDAIETSKLIQVDFKNANMYSKLNTQLEHANNYNLLDRILLLARVG